MGAVQFVLKGDKDEKKILSYNEKQRIYKEQSPILMSNFINDKGFQSDISRLTSGNITDKELNEIIDSYSPNNSNCKIKGLSYPKEAILNNKDMNIQEMNNTITRPSINQEEKEKMRRKQMEYNQILRQQVEERNKRKEMEKQKEKEEEIKFEEKLKRQLIENQKRAELIKNNEFKNNKYRWK